LEPPARKQSKREANSEGPEILDARCVDGLRL